MCEQTAAANSAKGGEDAQNGGDDLEDAPADPRDEAEDMEEEPPVEDTVVDVS